MKSINLIGTSGTIGSGKDTIGMIIQYLTDKSNIGYTHSDGLEDYISYLKNGHNSKSNWQIRKFAYKLKLIVSILTGIPIVDLEEEEVKNRILGEEWDYYVATNRTADEYYENDFISEYTNSCITKEEAEFKIKKQTIFNSNYKVEKLNYTVRQLLQRIGTDAMRNTIHPNIWINALFADYIDKEYSTCTCGFINENCRHEDEVVYPNWIITDVRFPNELQAIKDRGGIVIRVERIEEGKTYLVQHKHNDEQNNIFQVVACKDDRGYDKLVFKDSNNCIYRQNDYRIINEDLHESETALNNTEFDYTIINDGSIEDLIPKVKEILIKEQII